MDAADALQISAQLDPRKHRLFLSDRDIRTAREAVVDAKLGLQVIGVDSLLNLDQILGERGDPAVADATFFLLSQH